ncbi:MAG: FAD-dependent oxidoreductase [Pseudomonadota bacterium]
MSESCVIVGAGHCAGQLVGSLRQGGYGGAITMIGDEPYHPYQRPPLSKGFLAGEMDMDQVYFKPPAFYEGVDTRVLSGKRVEEIDRAGKRVVLSDGEALGYDKLVLATGARPRRLTMAGADDPRLFYLRSIKDVLGIREHFHPGARAVIVGGGYIGLEVAAVAAKRGLQVTVLEMDSRVMSRVVAPEISAFYEAAHTAKGVKLLTGVGVTGFEPSPEALTVLCSDGSSVPADLVIVGVGVVPNSELAEAAGLTCENGIVVDPHCQTSDPHVYAAGDCTNHPSSHYGGRIRLECVQNALGQAKTTAAALTDAHSPYGEIPWFWSDQYDLKLQIAGLNQGHDQRVLRGDPATDSFALYYLKDGAVIAVDAINSPRDFMMAKRLIAARKVVDPVRLADPGVPLKELA